LKKRLVYVFIENELLDDSLDQSEFFLWMMGWLEEEEECYYY
jgi:hypothetical protein